MLAGGPGQKGTFYLSRAAGFVEHIRDDFVLYFPTHRGIGRSGKLAKSGMWATGELNGSESKGIPPIRSVTVTNAAWDVVELAKAIKAGSDFLGDSRLFLYGCSYGALWGTRVLQLAPRGFFTAFLMNSPFVVKNFMDVRNDRDFIASCERSPFCKAQLDGQPERIRNVVSWVGNPEFNGCTAALHALMERLDIGGGDVPLAEPKSYSRLLLFLRKMLFDGVQSSMATVPLLVQLYKCPSVPQFEEKVMPVLATMASAWAGPAKPATHGDDPVMPERPVHGDEVLHRLGNGSSINALVNVHVMATELYSMRDGRTPEECQAACPYGLLTDCPIYRQYKGHFDRLLAKHAVSPDPLRLAPLDAGPTKIVIYHSAMDTNTALPAVEAFFNDIRVDAGRTGGSKALHVSLTREHSGLLYGRCTGFIFDEFLRDGSGHFTDLCLQVENALGPDWEFNSKPAFKAWWIPMELNQKLPELPALPDLTVTTQVRTNLPAVSACTQPKEQSWKAFVLLAILLLTLPVSIVIYRLYRRHYG
jgi:pimeloyl-ACP methyl ester carboxylesterase